MVRSLVFRKCNNCSFYNLEDAKVCTNCKDIFTKQVRIYFQLADGLIPYCRFLGCLFSSKNYIRKLKAPRSSELIYDQLRETFESAKQRLLKSFTYYCDNCKGTSTVPKKDIIFSDDNGKVSYTNFLTQWQCSVCGHYNNDYIYQRPNTFCSNCKLGRDADSVMIENAKRQRQLQQRQEDEKYIRNLQEIEDVEAAKLAGKVRGMKEMVRLLLEFTEEFDRRNMRFDEMALRSYLQVSGVANAENNDLLNAAIQIAMSQRKQ